MAVFKFRNLKNGQATAVPTGTFSIGRSDDAYVYLDDPSVSWRHAQLINNEKGFFLEDLGSSNGTSVHGSYLTGLTQINIGDFVQIGGLSFRIDPEVGGTGETMLVPAVGLQRPPRGFVRKATERISLDSVAPSESAETEASPNTPKSLLRKSVPLPTLAKLTESSPVPMPEPKPAVATPVAVAAPAPALVAAPKKEQEEEEEEENTLATQSKLEWFLVVFLAGLGTGVFIGLCFAKVFIDLGGKLNYLP